MSFRPTPIEAAEKAFVERLVRHLGFGARDAALIGEGSNNWVYRVGDGSVAIVLKLGKPDRTKFALKEHAKELWCAKAAREAGVPTPEITLAAEFDGRAYQLQALAHGRPPKAAERLSVWESMGRWARVIHSLPVSGWGPNFDGDDVFDGDWADHIAYNIEALAADDPLLALGVLDNVTSEELKRRFQELAERPFAIGLCHGDLALHNLLVDDNSGAITLVDWGSAGAFPVPHYEFNEIVGAGNATDAEMDALRKGYGLSDGTFESIQSVQRDLSALREVDTLRWALVHRRGELAARIGRAKRAVARIRPRSRGSNRALSGRSPR